MLSGRKNFTEEQRQCLIEAYENKTFIMRWELFPVKEDMIVIISDLNFADDTFSVYCINLKERYKPRGINFLYEELHTGKVSYFIPLE